MVKTTLKDLTCMRINSSLRHADWLMQPEWTLACMTLIRMDMWIMYLCSMPDIAKRNGLRKTQYGHTNTTYRLHTNQSL